MVLSSVTFVKASVPSCVREVSVSAAHSTNNHLCFAAASDVAEQSLFAPLEEEVNIQSWLSLRFFMAFHYLSSHFTLSAGRFVDNILDINLLTCLMALVYLN